MRAKRPVRNKIFFLQSFLNLIVLVVMLLDICTNFGRDLILKGKQCLHQN